jgi:hypothetical protein
MHSLFVTALAAFVVGISIFLFDITDAFLVHTVEREVRMPFQSEFLL